MSRFSRTGYYNIKTVFFGTFSELSRFVGVLWAEQTIAETSTSNCFKTLMQFCKTEKSESLPLQQQLLVFFQHWSHP